MFAATLLQLIDVKRATSHKFQAAVDPSLQFRVVRKLNQSSVVIPGLYDCICILQGPINQGTGCFKNFKLHRQRLRIVQKTTGFWFELRRRRLLGVAFSAAAAAPRAASAANTSRRRICCRAAASLPMQQSLNTAMRIDPR